MEELLRLKENLYYSSITSNPSDIIDNPIADFDKATWKIIKKIIIVNWYAITTMKSVGLKPSSIILVKLWLLDLEIIYKDILNGFIHRNP